MSINLQNLVVFTGKAHGKWVAATNRAPFFCFEADTEKEALKLASDALKFYTATQPQKDQSFAGFESFEPANRVRASELAAA